MTATSERDRLAAALQAVDARLGPFPPPVRLLVERAGLLAALGRTDEAKAQYLEALTRDPSDFDALVNFGVLLSQTNFRAAARTLFSQAVAIHPDQPLGHVNLANLLMYEDELDAARAHFETALRLDPDNLPAHQRLSGLLHELGDLEGMRRHRRLGFGPEPARSYPHIGEGEPIPLLVLTSTPAGDLAWPTIVDERVFAVTTVVAEFFDPAAPLPPHALILNAIGDADLSAPDLVAAEALVARSSAPVINPPGRVAPTGRAANAARLADLPGVVAPKVAVLAKATLTSAGAAARLVAEGFGFPLLLRSPGFHTGRHFVRVDHPADLAAAAAALPGAEVMAIQHLEARGADGYVRKYRVMMIDGALYPLHLALSADWKVHYATSAMSEVAAFHAEEARFLEHMPEALGARCMTVLAAIQDRLGLDYAGVDFAVGPDGDLLLFETNAVMKIVPPDASPQWDYRRPAVTRATEAARRMLLERAGVRPKGL
jgi:glutathione synthase/RimK-type ligase-like ATP-grasp enzyme